MIYDNILKIPENLFFETEVKVVKTRKKMIHFTEELKNRLAIYNYLCQHGKELRSDKDFKKQIKVKHLDESTFELFNCSWEQSEDLIFIWTEHCGYLYFFKEDIEFLDIQEWEWHGEEKEAEKRWQIVEHNFINFNMEVKSE